MTIPRQLRQRGLARELFDVALRDDGVYELRPQVPINASQAWFWSERWQRMEREAEQAIAAGHVRAFDDVESFLANLDSAGSPRTRGYTRPMVEPTAPSAISVHVRLFASYREAAGTSREELMVPFGSRVSDLTAALRERFPRLAPNGGLVAVNHEYVGESFTLHDEDEVAFIPPVSGGAFTPSAGSEGSFSAQGPCSG